MKLTLLPFFFGLLAVVLQPAAARHSARHRATVKHKGFRKPRVSWYNWFLNQPNIDPTDDELMVTAEANTVKKQLRAALEEQYPTTDRTSEEVNETKEELLQVQLEIAMETRVLKDMAEIAVYVPTNTGGGLLVNLFANRMGEQFLEQLKEKGLEEFRLGVYLNHARPLLKNKLFPEPKNLPDFVANAQAVAFLRNKQHAIVNKLEEEAKALREKLKLQAVVIPTLQVMATHSAAIETLDATLESARQQAAVKANELAKQLKKEESARTELDKKSAEEKAVLQQLARVNLRVGHGLHEKGLQDTEKEIKRLEEQIVKMQKQIVELRQKMVDDTQAKEVARQQKQGLVDKKMAFIPIIETLTRKHSQEYYAAQELQREFDEQQAKIRAMETQKQNHWDAVWGATPHIQISGTSSADLNEHIKDQKRRVAEIERMVVGLRANAPVLA